MYDTYVKENMMSLPYYPDSRVTHQRASCPQDLPLLSKTEGRTIS